MVSWDFMVFLWDFMGFTLRSTATVCELEAMAIEIVDVPIENGDFL